MRDIRGPLDLGKTFLVLFSITAVLIVAVLVVGDKLFSDITPYYWITVMILVLFAYGFQAAVIVDKKVGTANPRQIISLYMMLKGIKIVLFLATLTVYMLAVQIETKRFVLVASLIYLVYLLFDVFFLVSVEKNLKKNGK